MPADPSALSSAAGPSSGSKKGLGAVISASACQACRKAKTRCNKARPVCSNCSDTGRSCQYGTDGRSLRGSVVSVISLQARITELEAQLEVATSLPSRGSQRLNSLRHTSSVQASTRWLPGGSLSLSSSGALRYLDSTSSFFRTNPVDARNSSAPSTPSRDLTAGGISLDYLPLPLDSQLHQLVLDLAFSRMLSYCGFVREFPFRRDLAASPLRRTANYSPFLHLACLAHGARYLPQDLQHLICAPGESSNDRGQTFANAAKGMVEKEAANPDLSFLRGLLVLSAFMVGMGQDRLAVMYEGLATVIARDFRLHLTYEPAPNDPGLPKDWRTILDDRRQLFVTLSCVDVQWSSYLGRESSIPRTYVTQPLPPIPQNPFDLPLVELALAYHARLAVVASFAIEEVYNDQFSDVDAHIQSVLGYLEELAQWCRTIPEPLQLESDRAVILAEPHIVTLVMFFHAVRILLCRPFIGTVQTHRSIDTIRRICKASAWEIVRITRLRRSASGSSYGALTNQENVFIAGSILVLIASGHFPDSDENLSHPVTLSEEAARSLENQTPTESALAALRDLCGFLRDFGEDVWPNALQSAQTLEKVWAEFTRS